jgi:hypothetical protein
MKTRIVRIKTSSSVQTPVRRFSAIGCSLFWLAVLGASACAGIDADSIDGAPAGTTAGESAEESGTILATIALADGHAVTFRQAESGLAFVAETGEVGHGAPRLSAPEIEGKSLVEMYRALAPAAEVPRALLDAEAQSTALAHDATDAPTDVGGNGSGPAFYTSGEQTWFKETICPGAVKCIQAWDWIDSGYDYTTSWMATALVGSEGTVPVTQRAYYWSCSGGGCNWVQFNAVNVFPGHYTRLASTGLFYYKSSFDGAGAGTQVSMAIQDATYQCAHCNDGSCQCGYMDGNNLCAGRGGNDPSIGCGH